MGEDLGDLPMILRWGVILGLSVLAIGVVADHLWGFQLISEVGLFLIVATPISFLLFLSYKMMIERKYEIVILALVTLSVIAASALLSLR